jgi:HlyD family secretion protein
MKKLGIAVVILGVIGIGACLTLKGGKPAGTGVEVQSAEHRVISSRAKGTGEITPEKKVEISAKVVGEIINLPVVEGQRVEEGQLLAEIERDLYVAARDQARAALQQAKVAVRRQQVQLADSERNLKRVEELRADGLVSQEALDAAQLSVDMADVELEAQRHGVEQSASALQRAEDDLERTTIRSPMDGILIQLDVEKGETVVPGSTNLPGSVMMVVADMSRLLAEVEVSEVDVVDVKLGQLAEVEVDALGDRLQSGRVVEIATSGRRDPAQGIIRFRVKVALEDPDPSLRPAMTAKVDILTATSTDALAVPIQSVVKRALDDEGAETTDFGADLVDVVYLVEDGRTTHRRVTTGISDELFVEILDGLEGGEDVVVGPYRTLKDLGSGEPVFKMAPARGSTAEEENSGGLRIDVG